MTTDARERAGITDELVRLSIGIEDADDLWRDLELGLERARSSRKRSRSARVGF